MSGDGRKISALSELPTQIAPPRDLWQGIEARLAAEPRAATSASTVGAPAAAAKRRAFGAASGRLRILAAAAVIAALAIGIWIGRSVMPFGPTPGGAPQLAQTPPAGQSAAGDPGMVRAGYLTDSRYAQQRAALVQSLDARLAALPPATRTKVIGSLKTIHDSMRDLEAALGHDPSNALLQELLVNTYQDEMRVLTAVHEAGSTREGI